MEPVDFQNLTPEMLRQFIDRHTESSYWLVDVRQPDEYETAHIPGARLMPLPEIEARLYELPEDQDLIFYCHSGGRSSYAASLAIEGEVTQKTVAHLAGGILAWDGKTLADFPRVEVFDAAADFQDLLMTAMDLERSLRKLPHGARTVFVLHEIEGYKHHEIAEERLQPRPI